MFTKIEEKEAFWQSKYEYCKQIIKWVAIAASASSILYYFSDCYLMGGFETDTLIPRLSILIPLITFLVLLKTNNSYKVIVPAAYIVAHGVMWCTIWACAYLPNLDFAAEGFVIINYVFLAMGIGTPIYMGVIAHGFLIVDIIIANSFIQYPEFEMMLLLGIPSYLGICAYNIAVERSYKDKYKLQVQLKECLMHDSLTGAYNRNIMAELVDKYRHFIVGQKDVSVIMFDLDHFKEINDTYGHDSGDNVLVEISRIISEILPEDAKYIRWGGEEFVILSYDSTDNSLALAEKLRSTIEEKEFEVPNVTISVGVAAYEGSNYELTIKHADEALYVAKEKGRNRVEIIR